MWAVIVGTLVGFIAGTIYELFFSKPKESPEEKKELLEIEKNQAKNSGLIEAEEIKREQIRNEKHKASLQDVADYINNRNKDK